MSRPGEATGTGCCGAGGKSTTPILMDAEECGRDVDRYLRMGQKTAAAPRCGASANHAKREWPTPMSETCAPPINGILGMLTIADTCRDNKHDCLAYISIALTGQLAGR